MTIGTVKRIANRIHKAALQMRLGIRQRWTSIFMQTGPSKAPGRRGSTRTVTVTASHLYGSPVTTEKSGSQMNLMIQLDPCGVLLLLGKNPKFGMVRGK